MRGPPGIGPAGAKPSAPPCTLPICSTPCGPPPAPKRADLGAAKQMMQTPTPKNHRVPLRRARQLGVHEAREEEREGGPAGRTKLVCNGVAEQHSS
jgi:hypothetical protein